MDLSTPIDQYCERTDPSLWSEPLNLSSNLAFIISGVLIYRAIKKTPASLQMPGSYLLVTLILFIGLGSALFHSLATVWSIWCDVVPILLFLMTYGWLFCRHVFEANRIGSIAGLVGFGMLTAAAGSLAHNEKANGGEWYFGTWITLFGISCFYAGRNQVMNSQRMMIACILFSAAIFFRTIDLQVCDHWSVGTHLFWHLLNAVVIYLSTKAYISEHLHTADARTPVRVKDL